MEQEIVKFEDILIGTLKRWKSILIFALLVTSLGVFVNKKSDVITTYNGNFKVFVKSKTVLNENNITVKKDPNTIQNYIELLKTRNFVENALKRVNLNIPPQSVISGLEIFNLDKSDFIQVKYSSGNKDQSEKVLIGLRDEFLAVAKDYNENAEVSIEEDIVISEKVDIRNTKMIVVFAFIAGSLLGIAVAFVLECLNKTFRSKGEIERFLQVPVISSVPKLKNNQLNEYIIKGGKGSILSEAYNSLATNIKYGDTKVKSILVTSSLSNEGSTTTAINLAIALGASNNKVILIDGDLRKPSIKNILNIENNKGLTDVILGKVELQNAINKLTDNISVLTSGTEVSNTIEILDSEKMSSLLEKLNEDYDYIVIDTPPLQAVTDSKLLAGKVDTNILVIRAEMIKRDIAKESLEGIKSVNGNVMGIVFNATDKVRNKYYHYSN